MNIDLTDHSLHKLPQNTPDKIDGYFDCSNNSLISLKGSPKEVGFYFDCSNNSLTSLKGAPRIVNGSFFCKDNKLTTLEGAPEEVGEDFDCSNNNISLKNVMTGLWNIKIGDFIKTDYKFDFKVFFERGNYRKIKMLFSGRH